MEGRAMQTNNEVYDFVRECMWLYNFFCDTDTKYTVFSYSLLESKTLNFSIFEGKPLIKSHNTDCIALNRTIS